MAAADGEGGAVREGLVLVWVSSGEGLRTSPENGLGDAAELGLSQFRHNGGQGFAVVGRQTLEVFGGDGGPLQRGQQVDGGGADVPACGAGHSRIDQGQVVSGHGAEAAGRLESSDRQMAGVFPGAD